MNLIYKILLTLIIAIASGVLGRMGGAEGYDTKYRDAGCAILSVIVFCIWFGFKSHFWYLYLIAIGLHWGAYSTYFDTVFGFDNLWFSGFITGLALLPLLFIHKMIPFYISRALLLAILWGICNKCLPSKVFYWRHDIAEEFLRYFSVIITYLLKIIK